MERAPLVKVSPGGDRVWRYEQMLWMSAPDMEAAYPPE